MVKNRDDLIAKLSGEFARGESSQDKRQLFAEQIRDYFAKYDAFVKAVKKKIYTTRVSEFVSMARSTFASLRGFEESYAFASQNLAEEVNRLPYGRMEAKYG